MCPLKRVTIAKHTTTPSDEPAATAALLFAPFLLLSFFALFALFTSAWGERVQLVTNTIYTRK